MAAEPKAKPQAKKPGKRGPKPLKALVTTDEGMSLAPGVPPPVVVRNPVGRPTKYDPSWMLAKVIEVGRHGGTHAEMCIELGIVPDTFHNWLHTHPEFSEAVKKADTAAQVWWERAARNGAMGQIQGWNPTTYIFHMKNRFRADYKDKPEVEVNMPVQVAPVVIDSRTLTYEQREQLKQALLAVKAAQEGQTIDGEYEEYDEDEEYEDDE